MAKEKQAITVVDKKTKRMRMFSEAPIWKSIFLMGWPAMLMMLFTGLFYFCDVILAINFADDSYQTTDGVDGAHQVRMYTGAFAPILSVVLALSLLMALGTSTRVSINMGRKDIDRAKNTIRTGVMVSMMFSFILLPVLMFSANPWMAGQMENSSPNLTGQKIANTAMNFAWIMIAMTPFQFFNQMCGGLFRTEARNRQTLIASSLPILLNLLLDWLFMGPAGMGIEGAAWATFISTAFSSLIFVLFIIRDRHHSSITFKNLFGKFKIIPIVGILLVGVAPFFRNMAQSITQTVEMQVMTSVGDTVYGSHGSAASLLLKSTFLGVAPIFNLFFPILFGLAQGVGPIASFNYGAKNYKRVRQTYLWGFVYATSTGLICWVLSSYALGGPLLNALGIYDTKIATGTLSYLNPLTNVQMAMEVQVPFDKVGNIDQIKQIYHLPTGLNATFIQEGPAFDQYSTALRIISITMLTSIFFGGAIAGMILLSSTDRFLFSLIASTLRGIILFFPLVYLFRYLAIQNPGNEFLFWWFFPVIGLATSIIITGMAVYTIRTIDQKEVSIDERISMVYVWNSARKEFKNSYKQATSKKAKTELRLQYQKIIANRRVNHWLKLRKMPFYAKHLINGNSIYRQAAEKLKISQS